MTLSLNDPRAEVRVARWFSRFLREYLTEEQMEQVILRNRQEVDKHLICHSHDFLDANEVFAEAFFRVFYREPNATSPLIEGRGGFWDRSWSLAKKAEFDPSRIALGG